MELFRDRFGRWVRLSDERRAHLSEHPEMRGIESFLPIALGDPDVVVESLSDSLVWLYLLMNLAARLRLATRETNCVVRHMHLGEKLLCVAVKSSPTGAFVLTAYLTNRPKRGTRVWPLDA